MKQALQQGFTSRSRWLLQILGLTNPHQIKDTGCKTQDLHTSDFGMQILD